MSHQVLVLGQTTEKPLTVTVQIEGNPFRMEIDTGTSMSLMSQNTWKSKFPWLKLKDIKVTVRTYSSEKLSVLGQVQVSVVHESRQMVLPMLTIEGFGPSLLGRNRLSKLNLWKSISLLRVSSKEQSTDILVDKFPDDFREGLGTIKTSKASLKVKTGSRPRFYKTRSVPFALKGAIEEKLARMQTLGALEAVDHSEWTAPIVPVPKQDGSIRICGDYKLTVNQVDVDKYPLPKPNELFACLVRGKKFTKLNMSHAYNQLMLDKIQGTSL